MFKNKITNYYNKLTNQQMFSINIENLNTNNVIISEPIKNSMIEQSLFYKLLYSIDFITFNGIFLYFQFENINYNKDRIILTKDNENNSKILNNIINIENSLFNIMNSNKKKNYKLSELINNNNIKFSKSDIININEYNESKQLHNLNDLNEFNYFNKFNEFNDIYDKNKHNFILKISGFWETNDNIGITFKIIKVNKVLNLF